MKKNLYFHGGDAKSPLNSRVCITQYVNSKEIRLTNYTVYSKRSEVETANENTI